MKYVKLGKFGTEVSAVALGCMSLSTEHLSEDENATFTMRFTGRRTRWYATKDAASGIAAVSIDGGAETRVDLYTYCVEPQYGRQVFDTGDLPAGEHQLVVRVSGRKREQSRGIKVSVDCIEVVA